MKYILGANCLSASFYFFCRTKKLIICLIAIILCAGKLLPKLLGVSPPPEFWLIFSFFPLFLLPFLIRVQPSDARFYLSSCSIAGQVKMHISQSTQNNPLSGSRIVIETMRLVKESDHHGLSSIILCSPHLGLVNRREGIAELLNVRIARLGLPWIVEDHGVESGLWWNINGFLFMRTYGKMIDRHNLAMNLQGRPLFGTLRLVRDLAAGEPDSRHRARSVPT